MVQNLSIGRKLLLMLFLPMSGLAIVTGGYVLEVRRTAGNAEDVAQLARLASTINAFLHQTQRERGRTGLFVASEGRDAGPELAAQRAATDSAATALEVQLAALRRERLGGDFNASLDTAVTRYFRRLGEHRSEVDALRLGSQAATGYYTGMNHAFLQVILRLGALSRDGHLAMLFDVYGSLLYAKEAAGMQRALLSGAFTRGRFSDGAEFQAFLLAAGEESSQLTNFLGAASPAERMLYDSVVQGTDEREVARLRGYALASAGRAPLTGATAGSWFKVSTRRIDQLKRVTDRLAAEVEERAEQLAVRSRRLWVASLLGTVVVLCGALVLALRVGRGLARGLAQTMTALEAVAAGDLSQELAVEGRDEVARMAAALNRAIGAQRQALAEVRTQVSRAESAAEAARQAGLEAQAASDRQRAMEAAASEREREHAERERLDLEERRRRDEAQAEAIRLRDREQAAHEREESERLRASVDRILEVVNAAAEGDLTRAVPDLGAGAIGQLGGGLAQFLTDLRGSVGHIATAATALASAAEELTATSQTLSTGAEETSAQAGVVSAGSTQVACSVQSVAAAAEEMDTSIREIARNATEAAQVAAEAVEVVAGANAAMAKLGASSHEIGDVMKVITSIAEQTNLLALNATIEAARAGEAGRGFGIVANEVKDLARGTARATEEISARIEAIQVDTTAAVAAIQRINRIITQISDRQTAIAGAVEEQSVTTREIGRSVGEAARGADEITRSITGVATAAQGTSQGANHTREASGELARLASDLQALVGSFRYQDAPTPIPSP